MATVAVSILGLGRIGASIALALNRYNENKSAQHQFVLTLADMRAGIREDAAKVGLSNVGRDLFAAARNQDIVVLALPYADMQTAYRNIGPELRPGAVVLDLSPLKQPSLKWAAEHLPQEVHMVGITPILNPRYLFDELDDTLHAHADLFDKGNMLLMPSISAIKDAIELASDFSVLLGAVPHFADPVEHDSLVALTEGLPGLLGIVAFYSAYKNAGWNDMQRFTNPAFGRLTHHLYDTHPDDLRDTWLNNRQNMVRHLDELLANLQTFRGLLAHGDRDTIEAALVEASDAYGDWINRRSHARWDEGKTELKPPSLTNTVMSGFMGGFLSRRLSGRKNGDNE